MSPRGACGKKGFFSMDNTVEQESLSEAKDSLAQALLRELRALPTVRRLNTDWQSDATVRRLIYSLQDYIRVKDTQV